MTGTRGLAVAVVASLALHGIAAATLRALGFGALFDPSATTLALVVDLVDPIVARPDGAGSASEDRALGGPAAAPAQHPASASAPASRRASGPPVPSSAPRAPANEALARAPGPSASPEPPRSFPVARAPLPDGAPTAPRPPAPSLEAAPAPRAAQPPASDPVPGAPVVVPPALARAPDAGPVAPTPPIVEGPRPPSVPGPSSSDGPGHSIEFGASPGGADSETWSARAGSGRDERGPAAPGPGSGEIDPGTRSGRPPGSAADGGDRAGTGRTALSRGAGEGAGVPLEYDAYVRSLRQRIQERLGYPVVAVRRRLEGTVELEVLVDADGRLARARVVGGEGAPVLQEAALRAARDATPLPFPAGVAPRPLRIRLPVVFALR
jgi:periplasmic protein TonB